MEPWAARTPVRRPPAGSVARHRTPRHATAPNSSVAHRIAGGRISSPPAFSPPAFFLPVWVPLWPTGAAAPAFLWASGSRSFRPAWLRVWAQAAVAGPAESAWVPPAPAARAQVKRPPQKAGREPVSAARVWAAALARVPRPPAPPVWRPVAAGSGSGGSLGSPVLSWRAERLSASLPP